MKQYKKHKKPHNSGFISVFGKFWWDTDFYESRDNVIRPKHLQYFQRKEHKSHEHAWHQNNIKRQSRVSIPFHNKLIGRGQARVHTAIRKQEDPANDPGRSADIIQYVNDDPVEMFIIPVGSAQNEEEVAEVVDE